MWRVPNAQLQDELLRVTVDALLKQGVVSPEPSPLALLMGAAQVTDPASFLQAPAPSLYSAMDSQDIKTSPVEKQAASSPPNNLPVL